MSSRPHPLLLASASPRRRRLLAWLGAPYRTTAADIAEDLGQPMEPALLARRIAEEKAVATREAEHPADEIVVTCDTIVVLDGRVLGKPADIEDAYAMLRALSGRTHEVVTGVALLPPGNRAPLFSFAVVTKVRMRELSEADIDEWAAKGELLGCAGAYNIESHLATVESTECFQNVAGLPLCHLWRALATGGFGEIEGLTSPCAACEAARGVACELGRELTAEDSGD
jgi:septum formation protein